MWFHPNTITNILSLLHIIKKYRVTFDSGTTIVFLVHKLNKVIEFVQSASSLYYHDTMNHAISLIKTVVEKRKNYTKCQYYHATRAKDLQTKIGCPSINDFKVLVKKSFL